MISFKLGRSLSIAVAVSACLEASAIAQTNATSGAAALPPQLRSSQPLPTGTGGYVGGAGQQPRSVPTPHQQSFQQPTYQAPAMSQPAYRLAQQPAAPTQTAATAPINQTAATSTPANSASMAPAGTSSAAVNPRGLDLSPQPGEHPLMPALRWASGGMDDLRTIQDYSCTFYKRERIDGELGEYQSMFVKVRHNPFSVYMFFLGPGKLRGQECIFVRGQNNGNLLAHPTGFRKTVVGTVSLDPTGMIAMSGNRYPITEVGVLNLVERLVEIGERDTQYGECEVQFFQGAKINNRDCTCIQVIHPVPRRNFLFHLARIFVDTELNMPVRYEAYDWPEKQGGPPVLTEEYTYLNLKLNNGFTDADFSTDNPSYQFK
ncbi:MAG: DUF1571 domain-containing protein [Pirellulales bacterium]|nr:DUF1571 domain-containing protein [Pirellulales bacterium]